MFNLWLVHKFNNGSSQFAYVILKTSLARKKEDGELPLFYNTNCIANPTVSVHETRYYIFN